jgi:hypothetical protein
LNRHLSWSVQRLTSDGVQGLPNQSLKKGESLPSAQLRQEIQVVIAAHASSLALKHEFLRETAWPLAMRFPSVRQDDRKETAEAAESRVAPMRRVPVLARPRQHNAEVAVLEGSGGDSRNNCAISKVPRITTVVAMQSAAAAGRPPVGGQLEAQAPLAKLPALLGLVAAAHSHILPTRTSARLLYASAHSSGALERRGEEGDG